MFIVKNFVGSICIDTFEYSPWWWLYNQNMQDKTTLEINIIY